MSDLLNNPFIQAAVVPFVVSLILALVLRPLGWYWAGLAAVAGFVATSYLLTGLQLFPLRSDRKILLLGGGALAVGVLLDLIPWRKPMSLIALVGAAAASLWLLWPRFRFLDGAELWLLAIGGTLYVAWLSVSTIGLRTQAARADAVLLALGVGTGLTTLLGATALYGQLGSAIAAAVGARILLQLLGRPVAAGALMVLPLALICALLGIGALAYAKLPWFSLLPLALVPLMARIPLPLQWPQWSRSILLLVLALLPAVVAIVLTWQKTGAPPI